MIGKVMNFDIQGMQRDLGEAKFNPNFAYENMNIRITARDDNTLLTVTNERGNKQLLIIDADGKDFIIQGTTIGYCVLNSTLIIFTTSDNTDYIYIIDNNKDIFNGKILYQGDLNFDLNYPIECLGLYENEDVQKVYWIDGKNQPRMLNLKKTYTNPDLFNFAVSPNLDTRLTITKQDSSNGNFKAGVIQYGISLYNKNAQETPLIRFSDIYQIGPKDRGLEVNTPSNNSFKIDISNIDENYEYVNIYSLYRSSINNTPEVSLIGNYKPSYTWYRVMDECIDDVDDLDSVKLFINETEFITLEALDYSEFNNNMIFNNITKFSKIVTPNYTIEDSMENTYTINISNDLVCTIVRKDLSRFDYRTNITSISIVDTNNNTISLDPTILLYLGSEPIIANTLVQKDNTLFLGNIELLRDSLEGLKIDGVSISTILYNTAQDKMFNSYATINLESEDFVYYNYSINNNRSIDSSKIFKYGEHYRLGIQFQHKTGKWSEVVYLGDFTNNLPISRVGKKYASGKFSLSIPNNVNNLLIDNGYVRMRPMICYPSLQDRKVITQGIVCPTVYNFKHRYNHVPDVQSSWFMRPIYYGEYNGEYSNIGGDSAFPEGNRGINIEYKDATVLPNNLTRRCEIQSNAAANVYAPNSDYEGYTENYEDSYGVDGTIITFHSPDIENSEELDNMDFSNLDFRIVGIAQVDSVYGTIDMQTNNTGDNGGVFVGTALGYNKGDLNTSGVVSIYTPWSLVSKVSGNKVSAVAVWNDVFKADSNSTAKVRSNFVIYPWHNSSSILGDGNNCKITKKILSNETYSSNSYYFENTDIIDYSEGITIPQLYLPENSEGIIKIQSPKNSTLQDLVYKGSVDTIINSKNITPYYTKTNVRTATGDTLITNHQQLSVSEINNGSLSPKIESTPISIKYKSNKHLVFGFNYESKNTAFRLPEVGLTGDYKSLPKAPAYFYGSIPSYNSKIPKGLANYCTLMNLIKKYTKFTTDANYTNGICPSCLLIGELYRKNVANAFGGTSESVLQNNNYLIGGNSTKMYKNSVTSLSYSYGDTFLQRYDCLKTVPYEDNAINSIVDITSVICESRVNMDSRYDRNRGLIDNTNIRLDNFNKINTVYNQNNNYFTYHTVDIKNTLKKFFNTITWSKTKVFNEEVDTWANITLASTLDLDGDKGTLNCLRRFNNEIFAFQDKGISKILFNSRVQIAASDGVPIEISNSAKVDGKVYLTDTMGTSNKWSVKTTPSGIYFIDNLNSSISILNGEGINSLSDKLGFRTFIGSENSLDVWNPSFNNKGFVTFYDATEDDVYFINKDYCLCYSELLGQFTSFYSYNKVPAMFNINNRFYSIYSNTLYKQNAGEYNEYFGKFNPYYIKIIANQELGVDKIFNTIEFNSEYKNSEGIDIYDKTFNYLEVENRFQHNKVELKYKKNLPSNLKRKYSIWRAEIPRESGTMNRIRSPWTYIKLSQETPNNDKFKLHDLKVWYF